MTSCGKKAASTASNKVVPATTAAVDTSKLHNNTMLQNTALLAALPAGPKGRSAQDLLCTSAASHQLLYP
jgi:hypothetical protein